MKARLTTILDRLRDAAGARLGTFLRRRGAFVSHSEIVRVAGEAVSRGFADGIARAEAEAKLRVACPLPQACEIKGGVCPWDRWGNCRGRECPLCLGCGYVEDLDEDGLSWWYDHPCPDCDRTGELAPEEGPACEDGR